MRNMFGWMETVMSQIKIGGLRYKKDDKMIMLGLDREMHDSAARTVQDKG